MNFRTKPSIILLAIAFLFPFTGCRTLKESADESGLRDIRDSLLPDVRPCSRSDIESLFATEQNRPVSPVPGILLTNGKPRWKLRIPGGRTAASVRLSTDSPAFGDRLVFDFYRPENWDGAGAVLWVPGFGVSDFAFGFIRRFMEEELRQGYAVLFYNLPFHLDRVQPGRKEGQGLVTGNLVSNVRILRALTSELETGAAYLQNAGVSRIGVWSGSVGAAAAGVLSADRDFDHICMMIPVVDWNTLIFHPVFNEVRHRLTNSLCGETTLRKAYDLVSPATHRPRTPPERILILSAEYDRLTPPDRIAEYAAARGITNVRVYPESHASILLNDGVYRDYALFLSNMARGRESR